MMRKTGVGRLTRPLAALLVGAAIVVGVAAGWQWLGKVRTVSHQQVRLGKALDARWSAAAAAAARRPNPTESGQPRPIAPERAAPQSGRAVPQSELGIDPPGAPIARLYLPTIGLELVVVEGSAEAQLRTGPGRIIGTQPLVGAGNAGIAGHRYPGVFWDLDRVESGDPVIVATATQWYVYRVNRTVTVEPSDRTVLVQPPPGSTALLTLVTCEPKLSTAHRLVKQAELVRVDPRDGPRPQELSVRSRR